MPELQSRKNVLGIFFFCKISCSECSWLVLFFKTILNLKIIALFFFCEDCAKLTETIFLQVRTRCAGYTTYCSLYYILQFCLKSSINWNAYLNLDFWNCGRASYSSPFWLAKVRLERRRIWALLAEFCLKEATSNKAVVHIQKDQISFDRDKNMSLIYFITSSISLLTLVTSISLTARNVVSFQKRLMRGWILFSLREDAGKFKDNALPGVPRGRFSSNEYLNQREDVSVVAVWSWGFNFYFNEACLGNLS